MPPPRTSPPRNSTRRSRRRRRLGIAGFVATQDEYSLLVRDIEKGLLPAIDRNGLGLVPYFPLASGVLTGKYRKGEPLPEGSRLAIAKGSYDRYATPENLDKVERLRAFAEGRGHTLLELAFSWLARRPNRRFDHRRCLMAGTARGERQGGRLGADRGGNGGYRPDCRAR